jgi:hypothetical protein
MPLRPKSFNAVRSASMLHFLCLKDATCEMTSNQQAFRTALRIYFHPPYQSFFATLVVKM